MKTILSLITSIIILSSNVNGYIEECKLDKEICLEKGVECETHKITPSTRSSGNTYTPD